MRILTTLMTVILLSLPVTAKADDVEASLELALSLHRATLVNNALDSAFSEFEKGKPDWDYHKAIAKAKSEKRTVVIFVGCEPRQVEGAICCYKETMKDYESPCVVVGVYGNDGKIYCAEVLKPDFSDEEVKKHIGVVKEINPPKVTQVPMPNFIKPQMQLQLTPNLMPPQPQMMPSQSFPDCPT